MKNLMEDFKNKMNQIFPKMNFREGYDHDIFGYYNGVVAGKDFLNDDYYSICTDADSFKFRIWERIYSEEEFIETLKKILSERG